MKVYYIRDSWLPVCSGIRTWPQLLLARTPRTKVKVFWPPRSCLCIWGKPENMHPRELSEIWSSNNKRFENLFNPNWDYQVLGPTFVTIGVDIKDIPKVSDQDFSITLNAYFNVKWRDPRLLVSRDLEVVREQRIYSSFE